MQQQVIKAWGEIALWVKDLDLMQQFYEQIFGFELTRRSPQMAFFEIAPGTADTLKFWRPLTVPSNAAIAVWRRQNPLSITLPPPSCGQTLLLKKTDSNAWECRWNPPIMLGCTGIRYS